MSRGKKQLFKGTKSISRNAQNIWAAPPVKHSLPLLSLSTDRHRWNAEKSDRGIHAVEGGRVNRRTTRRYIHVYRTETKMRDARLQFIKQTTLEASRRRTYDSCTQPAIHAAHFDEPKMKNAAWCKTSHVQQLCCACVDVFLSSAFYRRQLKTQSFGIGFSHRCERNVQVENAKKERQNAAKIRKILSSGRIQFLILTLTNRTSNRKYL